MDYFLDADRLNCRRRDTAEKPCLGTIQVIEIKEIKQNCENLGMAL